MIESDETIDARRLRSAAASVSFFLLVSSLIWCFLFPIVVPIDSGLNPCALERRISSREERQREKMEDDE